MSRANRETGKIQDGPDTLFRCFAASAEATYPSLRKMVWHNFELLRDALIQDKKAGFENSPHTAGFDSQQLAQKI